MEESANAARLMPAYNVDAQRPEDIYPLHNIIPELGWAVLDSVVPKLKNAADDHARARLLPNAHDDWLRQHLMLAYSSSKPKPKIVFVPIFAPYTTFSLYHTQFKTEKFLFTHR
jgi:DNA-directed RNA polymerase I subunit RPA49